MDVKIVVGVISIIFLCTGFNLLYSYYTFNSDKTTYLYESVQRKSETILNLINIYEEKIKDKAKSNFQLANNDQEYFRGALAKDSDMIFHTKFNINDINLDNENSYINQDKLVLLKNKTGVTIREVKENIKKYFKNIKKNSFNDVFFYTQKNDITYLVSLVKAESSQDVFVSILNASEINTFLQSDKNYINSIYFIGDNVSNNLSANKWIKQINYNKFKQSTLEVSLDSEVKLLAYSTSITGKYVVASYIDKNKALSITNFLIIKTILFSLVLLGVAVAISIYFSSAISYPLKELTAKANAVAVGNYDQHITFKSNDELGILASTFNIMTKEIHSQVKAKELFIKKLEKANKELERYMHNLEKMVEQRTLELKKVNTFMETMINSLDQGLFVFNKDLICNDIYTKACENIFNIKPAGKSLREVLNIEEEEEVNNLTQWSHITFSELISTESAIELGPKTYETTKNTFDVNYKHVSIDYFPIKNEKDELVNLVAVATDDTTEVLAIERAKENEDHVSMILKIIKNKAHFQSFCLEVNGIFDRLIDECLSSAALNLEICMMHFHTLNGGFGLYSINALRSEARNYEQEISNMKDLEKEVVSEYKKQLLINLEVFKNKFHKFLLNIDNEINTGFSAGTKKFEFSKEDLIIFREKIQQIKAPEELFQIYTNSFLKEPIGIYFNSYDELCKNLAINLGKKFTGISFKGEDIRVDASRYFELFNSLVHLFRNCIDHGIETIETRLSCGKNEAGLITVDFRIEDNYLIIKIKDDGGGIDPELIKSKYSKINPNIDLSNYSIESVLNLVFDPFFTTRETVSLTSGRGVGMSAIKEAVEKINGKILIFSEIGIGTTFEIIVPEYS